ncbi:MAG TPA: WecB/TagA/CpsF family glycosyltransferase [Clostridia bacterium]|jgi:N-acetylglucosaminyldiphosphoundecaprenol N-acetyl-beta-D-mannosaminyltransferase|nr:WecB/TagA/CpsF family glycosyltransferase [Clostridia bacterium]HOR89530.1 WecB/TagA/CpsF family glycosyltransferase [Clostridia bacterium]HPL08773.1 WecB/TagA/CpsF family glycosyltransferase [Clostridia bacterium]
MDILGIKIDNTDMEKALEKAYDALSDRTSFRYIFTPNAEICMAAIKDNSLMEVLNSSFMNIPDGDGVVLASKILKTPLKEKVPGCVFVQNLLGMGKSFSVYLLGASHDSVSTAAKKIQSRYPYITVAGFHDGFFNVDQEKEIIADINTGKPDLIIVGLGAPKQEFFIYKHRYNIHSGLAIGAGGTIDIISGFSKRAPEFFCKHKLEWFYRLLKQPARFKRMLSIPLFLIKCRQHARKAKKAFKKKNRRT